MSKDGWTSVALTDGLGEHAAAWDECNRHYFGGHMLFDSRFVGRLMKYFGSGRERLLFR
ncbi:MAG: hypothetical protein JNJ60_16305, partial [Rhodocyclaceae bacterium]|nr:hypothetical protein [Rhodocyclaceae bacterium]